MDTGAKPEAGGGALTSLSLNYFTAPLNRLMQKLLFLWVRTTDVPPTADALHIDTNKPLVYVLYQRSWSNLLVLSHDSKRLGLPSPFHRIKHPTLHKWRSVYTVAPRLPFKAWLLNQPKRSPLLRDLVEAVQQGEVEDVQLAPVTLFWGRPVAKQKHWLTLLFADSWQLASRTRKFFTILFHGRDTLVSFSQPLSLLDLIDDQASVDDNIDRVQQALTDRLVEMKTATLGPDVSHRNTLIREILSQPDVRDAIAQYAKQHKRSVYHATVRARKILREIVADCTNITIQLMQRVLTHFWNRFYAGIDVHHQSQLHKLALSHELVYVPSHRSHVDYLLLSYLIHSEGLAIPYIAAGKNLNMPVIGSILRGGGAFFIRRSFKDDPLYSALIFEYVATLVSRGMPLEYFIEGGRSRTGRLLKPKPGMLSMTIRGYLKYRSKPVAFIPVNIGYEKLIESKAYLAELAGEDKKSETLLGSIAAIFKLRGNYGRVSASFGEPVLLDAVLDKYNPDWAQQTFDKRDKPEWLFSTVNHCAKHIMRSINRSTAVNATNMIASILLATPRMTMDERELANMILLYTDLLKRCDYSERIRYPEHDPMHQIKHLESLKLVRRRTHELGDIIWLDEKQSVTLTYYKNNVLHLFALPSLVACCFLNMRSQTRDQIVNLIAIVYPFLKQELFLHWPARRIDDVVTQTLDNLSALGLLIKNDQLEVYTRPGSGTLEYSQLHQLSRIISPVLEVYYMTLALLSMHHEQPLSREQLESQSLLMAQRISMMNESNSPDYFDKKLIANFVDNLIATDFLHDEQSGELRFGEAFHTADKHARLLLSRATRTSILQMLKLNQQQG